MALVIVSPKTVLPSQSAAELLSISFRPLLIAVRVGFYRNEDGKLTRLLIPTVGGAGLYGDTAGILMEALFNKSIIPNLIPHILFSATAGGFANTDALPFFNEAQVKGLPAGHPDGFLMPTERIVDDTGRMEMTTLLKQAAARKALHSRLKKIEGLLEAAGVRRYSRHFSISHPGDETYQKIEKLVNEYLVSSVDVEAGPVQRAILKIRKSHPSATFTPIYNYSDDPRSGKENRFHTLAFGGPLHDNWKPDLRLNPVMEALIDLAYRLNTVR